MMYSGMVDGILRRIFYRKILLYRSVVAGRCKNQNSDKDRGKSHTPRILNLWNLVSLTKQADEPSKCSGGTLKAGVVITLATTLDNCLHLPLCPVVVKIFLHVRHQIVFFDIHRVGS